MYRVHNMEKGYSVPKNDSIIMPKRSRLKTYLALTHLHTHTHAHILLTSVKTLKYKKGSLKTNSLGNILVRFLLRIINYLYICTSI